MILTSIERDVKMTNEIDIIRKRQHGCHLYTVGPGAKTLCVYHIIEFGFAIGIFLSSDLKRKLLF